MNLKDQQSTEFDENYVHIMQVHQQNVIEFNKIYENHEIQDEEASAQSLKDYIKTGQLQGGTFQKQTSLPDCESPEYNINVSNIPESLQDFLQEQNQKNKQESSNEIERRRQEKIKQIAAKLNRQLSTINEMSDQSISVVANSPHPRQDHALEHQPSLDCIQESVLKQIIDEERLEQQVAKKKKKKKKKSQQNHNQKDHHHDQKSSLTHSSPERDILLQEHIEPPKLTRKRTKKRVSAKKTNTSLESIDDDYNKLLMEYEISFNLWKYLQDKRVDFDWKLMYMFFILILFSNILLNCIELGHYSNSGCKIGGLSNALIYINQIFYVLSKLGMMSLVYQEFTNTLPTKSIIPLVNPTLLCSIFPIISMPLYIFDFVTCSIRNALFSLQEAADFMSTIDWILLSGIVIVVILRNCLKVHISRERWKTIKFCLKMIMYILLSVFHIVQFLMILTQFQYTLQPAMFMENFFFFYSLVMMVYLSLKKFYLHKTPFQFIMTKENNEKNISEKEKEDLNMVSVTDKAIIQQMQHHQLATAHTTMDSKSQRQFRSIRNMNHLKTESDGSSQNQSIISTTTQAIQPLQQNISVQQLMELKVKLHDQDFQEP